MKEGKNAFQEMWSRANVIECIENQNARAFQAYCMRQSRNRYNEQQFIYLHIFQIIETRCQVKSSRLEVDLLPAERHAYALCAHCDTTRLKSIILLMVIVAVVAVSVTKDAEPAHAHTHSSHLYYFFFTSTQ